MLRFNDGINIDTSGEPRVIHLYDGYYVTGKGNLIPVKDSTEAEELLKSLKKGE